HLERAPGRAVARDLVLGQPLAVDVAGEVGACLAGGVDLVGRQAVDRGQGALVQGQSGSVAIGGGGGGGRAVVVAVAGGKRHGHGQGEQEEFRLVRGHGGSGALGWAGRRARPASADSTRPPVDRRV